MIYITVKQRKGYVAPSPQFRAYKSVLPPTLANLYVSTWLYLYKQFIPRWRHKRYLKKELIFKRAEQYDAWRPILVIPVTVAQYVNALQPYLYKQLLRRWKQNRYYKKEIKFDIWKEEIPSFGPASSLQTIAVNIIKILLKSVTLPK